MFTQFVINRHTAIRYCRQFDKYTHRKSNFSIKQQYTLQHRPHHTNGESTICKLSRFGSFSIIFKPPVNILNARHILNSNKLARRSFCTPSTPPQPKKVDRNWLSLRRQHQESKKEIRRLFSLAKNEKWYLIGAIGCLCISSVVTLGVPHAIGKIMDMIVMDDFPKAKLHQFCYILFAVFIAGSLANFGRIYLMNSAGKIINL